ncbi:MAG: PKD domain-containing protein [Candidatus Methanomethyliaceae archaeon]
MPLKITRTERFWRSLTRNYRETDLQRPVFWNLKRWQHSPVATITLTCATLTARRGQTAGLGERNACGQGNRTPPGGVGGGLDWAKWRSERMRARNSSGISGKEEAGRIKRGDRAMRQFLWTVLAFYLAGQCVLAQDTFRLENLWVEGGSVAPGATVLAQKVRIDTWVTEQVDPTAVLWWWNWEDASETINCNNTCAHTNSDSNWLDLGFSLPVPSNAVIRGIGVQVKGAATADDPYWRRLLLALSVRGVETPNWYMVWLPQGDCSSILERTAGGPDETWGWNWVPSDLQNLAVYIRAMMPPDCYTTPGTCPTFFVDCVKVSVYYALPTTRLQKVRIRNTADPSIAIQGSDVEKIEIVRVSDGRVIGTLTNAAELAKLTTSGATVSISSAYQAFTSSTEIHIRVKLKSTVALGKRLILGDTRCTINDVEHAIDYWIDPGLFEVGPAPYCTFDETMADLEQNVFAGERFLAGRLLINASETPFDLTLSELRVRNGGVWPLLSGRYISSIEVRRASDNALLGQQTSAIELEKFCTDQGTPVSLTANNVVPAYAQMWLEIWVTLKPDAPTGHKIKLQGDENLKISGTYINVSNSGPSCTVKVKEEGEVWLDVQNDDEVKNGGAVPGQRFLAQRLILTDDDADPYNVSLSSVLIKNIAANPLAEQHIALIELRRTDTDSTIGSSSSASGLSTTGIRIPLSTTVFDDTMVKVEIWITLRDTAPITIPERQIKLLSQVWYTEGGVSEPTPSDGVEGPVFDVVGPGGLEAIEKTIVAPGDRRVYPGQTFLAHVLKLQDDDRDPYNVTLQRILVKNLSVTSQVQDQHVAGIEIRDSTGKLLGQAATISGLTTTGVGISTVANNTIIDDKSLTVEIWITLKSDVPAGRKIILGARVEHTEGGENFSKPAEPAFLSSEVEFTTATDGARTVNFTYSPDKPKWSDEITFTPSVSPTTGIVYARWEFGDGFIVERRTSEGEKPLDPVKHTYGKGGEFIVVYAVRDDANREIRAAKNITVSNEPPKNVDFSVSPSSPTVNQNVTFTPSANIEDPDGDIKKATFRWDFGDGGTVVTTTGPQNVTRFYAQAGTYTVTLTVIDQGGAKSEVKKDITVGGFTPPTPQPPTVTSLTASTTTPAVGENVTFTATATTGANTPITGWKWDFGDGTPVQETTDTATTMSFTHAFQNVGTYTVRVWAKNSAGWSEARSIQIVVHPAGVEFGTVVLDNPVTGNQCRIQIFAPAGATDLKITILDQAGRPVILDKPVALGTFTWDLKDRDGRTVPNGLYLFFVTAKIQNETKRTEIGRILVRR